MNILIRKQRGDEKSYKTMLMKSVKFYVFVSNLSQNVQKINHLLTLGVADRVNYFFVISEILLNVNLKKYKILKGLM